MTIQYYIDQDKQLDVRVDDHNGKLYVSIYNDRTDNHSIGFSCNREELKGLADFIYKTVGEKK